MIGEAIVALGLLSAVAVAAVAADRRRRRPAADGEATAQELPEPAPPAGEDTIGQIEYEPPADDSLE